MHHGNLKFLKISFRNVFLYLLKKATFSKCFYVLVLLSAPIFFSPLPYNPFILTNRCLHSFTSSIYILNDLNCEKWNSPFPSCQIYLFDFFPILPWRRKDVGMNKTSFSYACSFSFASQTEALSMQAHKKAQKRMGNKGEKTFRQRRKRAKPGDSPGAVIYEEHEGTKIQTRLLLRRRGSFYFLFLFMKIQGIDRLL